VLIAEDNPVNQQVASTMLRRRGHTVEIVNNGQEAVEILRREKFDVVLMDLQMPILDGMGATAAIRAAETGKRTPIVALTANAATGERERCLAAGMDDYLSKPFRATDLITVVENIAAPEEQRVSRTIQVVADEKLDVDVEGLRSELRDAGAEDALGAVLSVYVSDAPARMEEINDAAASGDLDRIRRAAHAYKSSSGTIRATELAKYLQQMEGEAKDGGRLEKIRDLRDQVEASHLAVMKRLRTWLETNRG
jgi:CheY-like chemotaxis protein